jgi:hypothetical protein
VSRFDRGVRRSGAVVLAAMLLGVAVIAGPVGADDPADPSPTTLPGDSTTVPGDGSGSTTLLPGGVTTTTLTRPTVTAGPGGFGGPKVDPDAPPEPPMPDPSPEVRVLLAQLRIQSQEKFVAKKQAGLDKVRSLEGAASGRLTDARKALDRAHAQVRVSVRRLRDDALAQYISPGQTGLQRLVDTGPTTQRTRSILIGVSIAQDKKQRLAALDLVAARERVVQRRVDEVRVAHRATEAEQAKADAARELLDRRRQELANAQGLSPDWSLPIEGQSVFTGKELGEWFLQRGVRSRAQAPVTDLAEDYIAEGVAQGIRGDMAFAQSVLETGSFSNDDTIRLNNFAGIGHCDTCATGFAFANPDLGVRAQIQLLASYAKQGVVLKRPLVDHRLHGPSGCCQTWRDLTHTWATNGNYGPKIMGVYREMLYWLVVHRGLTPLVGPR